MNVLSNNKVLVVNYEFVIDFIVCFSALWIATGVCLVLCVSCVFLYAKLYPNAEFQALDGVFKTFSIFMNQDCDLADIRP